MFPWTNHTNPWNDEEEFLVRHIMMRFAIIMVEYLVPKMVYGGILQPRFHDILVYGG